MRYSERFYNNTLVEKKVVELAVNNARLSASSCNLQLTELILINDKEDLAYLYQNCTKKVDWCSQLFIVTFHKNITYERNANILSCGIFVERLMHELQNVGVSSCPIAGFYGEKKIRQRFSIKDELEIPLLLFFGYTDVDRSDYFRPYRTPVNNILHYDEYRENFSFSINRRLQSWSVDGLDEYRKRIQSLYVDRDAHAALPDEYYIGLFEILLSEMTGDVLICGTVPIRALDHLIQHSLRTINVVVHGGIFDFYVNLYANNPRVQIYKELDANLHVQTALITDGYHIMKDFDETIELLSKEPIKIFYARLSNMSLFGIYYSLSSIINPHSYHNHIFYKFGGFTMSRKMKYSSTVIAKYHSAMSNKIIRRLLWFCPQRVKSFLGKDTLVYKIND